MLEQFFPGNLSQGFHDNHQALAESFIFLAIRGTLINSLMTVECLFYLGTIDVFATGNDHIGFAVDDVKIVFLVEVADVAGRKPPISIEYR